METLLKELNEILKMKNEKIERLEWWVDVLGKKNSELEKKITELETDIEKHRKNEENRV
jgi:chaperonin cofactor prefoldin